MLTIIIILISYFLHQHCAWVNLWCILCTFPGYSEQVLNLASSSWGPVFLLRAARYFCRSPRFFLHNMQWINIVYGFWCAGRWFHRKFLDYFCCHLHQISGYVPTVYSIISIFTFYFLFCTLTLLSQSDCFVVLSYRWNYSIIGPRGCQNIARRGRQQNEGAAAAAAEPASTAAAPA